MKTAYYQCPCGQQFDSLFTLFLDGEKWAVCPFCRDTDWYEITACAVCYEAVCSLEISRNDGLCEVCATAAIKQLGRMLSYGFSPAEHTFLRAYFNERELP